MNKSKRKPSNCRQVNQGENCPGKYELTYDNNAPIFTCKGDDEDAARHRKFYDEYLQLYKIKESWDEPKNHVSCVIGMFCFLYKEHFKTDYTFVPKNPNPFGAKECKDAWTLLAAFNGSSHDARKYIYWVFKKAINKTTAITSFGYLNAPGLIRKYKIYAQRKDVLNRASKLPQAFVDWWQNNAKNIMSNYAMCTMNDLGAFINYVRHYDADIAADAEERKTLNMAEQLGLIKDGKLNVGEAK